LTAEADGAPSFAEEFDARPRGSRSDDQNCDNGRKLPRIRRDLHAEEEQSEKNTRFEVFSDAAVPCAFQYFF
jgi:hypothetical protein